MLSERVQKCIDAALAELAPQNALQEALMREMMLGQACIIEHALDAGLTEEQCMKLLFGDDA